jgi:hypothetical protein
MKPSHKFMAGAAFGVLMIYLAGVPSLLVAHGWKAPREAADRPNPVSGDRDSLARVMANRPAATGRWQRT